MAPELASVGAYKSFLAQQKAASAEEEEDLAGGELLAGQHSAELEKHRRGMPDGVVVLRRASEVGMQVQAWRLRQGAA